MTMRVAPRSVNRPTCAGSWRAMTDDAAKEACAATSDEKPAVSGESTRVSRHEAAACGDPGSGAETGAGGRDGRGGPLEGPATAGGGPETKGAEPNAEPLA